MMQLSPVVKQLLIINVIFFLGCIPLVHATDYFALHFFKNDSFRSWQFFSYMFMHGGFMHLFFNMFALFSFGTMLERIWGSSKFLFFYISCGLGAALVHMGVSFFIVQDVAHQLSSLQIAPDDFNFLMNANYNLSVDRDYKIVGEVNTLLEKYRFTQDQFNTLTLAVKEYQTPMVGASGAIYGLLVAFAFMFPNAELMMLFIPVPIKAKYYVTALVLLDLIMGYRGTSIFGGNSTGIAHFAHLGGALFGFIMMWVWRKNQFNQNRWN
jgi:membrane associated rhomboid family serine protease